jgi:alkylation response protein AidB-like acyl-CoA dehydrogenase
MSLHFDFSSEQGMLGASVKGLLLRAHKATNGGRQAADQELGRLLADHGVFGIMTPATAGGMDLGLTEALAVALEVGRTQARFPVIETIAAAQLLAGTRPAAAEQVLRGEQIATCAAAGEAILVSTRSGPLVRGRVTVPFAGDARWLALPVRKAESDEFVAWAAAIDLAAPGIAVSRAPEFDLTYPMFHVELDTPIEPTDAKVAGLSPLLAVLACGELTGAAEHCLERSLRHLKERVQFGKPIGVNQSLRHRAADDWMRIQGMQAASEYAAASFDAVRDGVAGTPFVPDDFERAVHVAKAYCSAAAREVAEHALQMHGGIGFTWEFGLHVPLRRILRLAASHGGVADHQNALAESLLRGNRSTQ